jgi:DNA-binding MarR family transcriptional regulator
VPRLDAPRLAAWRELLTVAGALQRSVDADVREEWDIALGWFDVLAALQRLGGWARPSALATELRLVPSSLSRRLDRLEEEGWVRRHAGADRADQRAVTVELTRRGRQLWREMNVTYRRAVQRHFATMLTNDQIEALRDVLASVDPVGEEPA